MLEIPVLFARDRRGMSYARLKIQSLSLEGSVKRMRVYDGGIEVQFDVCCSGGVVWIVREMARSGIVETSSWPCCLPEQSGVYYAYMDRLSMVPHSESVPSVVA